MQKEVKVKESMIEKRTTFCVVYDGPDHKHHEMNIMTLGRALTALGTVLYEANHALNGDRNSIKVEVNANFKKGSIGIDVALIQLLTHGADILQVLGFSGFVGAGTGTVVGALKALRGRDIKAIEKKDGDEDVKIIAEGIEITADKDVTKLVTNKTFRAAMEGLISAPLKNAGTTSFAIKRSIDEKKPLIKIDKTEEKAFSGLIVDIHEQSSTYEKKVKFIAADIKKTTGWKVEIDEKSRLVHMEDELFRERLLNMEEPHIFGKFFIVKVKETTSTRLNKTSSSFTIIRVQHETT
ncbi:MAG TPA: hypothetical protein VL995_21140 [Cellvibrio sp.]|nr:hypothetical protein [Cellvibrio sp.]